jgi:hypothetical protein
MTTVAANMLRCIQKNAMWHVLICLEMAGDRFKHLLCLWFDDLTGTGILKAKHSTTYCCTVLTKESHYGELVHKFSFMLYIA